MLNGVGDFGSSKEKWGGTLLSLEDFSCSVLSFLLWVQYNSYVGHKWTLIYRAIFSFITKMLNFVIDGSCFVTSLDTIILIIVFALDSSYNFFVFF